MPLRVPPWVLRGHSQERFPRSGRLPRRRGLGYSMGMTQTSTAAAHTLTTTTEVEVSGIYTVVKGEWNANTDGLHAEVTAEAASSSDCCAMQVTATVHDADGLDALIAMLQARRADVAEMQRVYAS